MLKARIETKVSSMCMIILKIVDLPKFKSKINIFSNNRNMINKESKNNRIRTIMTIKYKKLIKMSINDNILIIFTSMLL